MVRSHKIVAIVALFLLGIIFFYRCEEQIPAGPPRVEVVEAELYTSFDRTDYPQPTNFSNRWVLLPRDAPPPETGYDSWAQLLDSVVRFRIKVNNIFDETVDGLKWIDVKLRYWSINYPEIKGTLSYQNYNEDSTLIVLHPDKSYYVYTSDSLVWDQTYEHGESIHSIGQFLDYEIRVDSTWDIIEGKWDYFCDTTYTTWKDTVIAFDLPIKLKAQAEVKIFKNYEAILSNVFRFTITYFFPTAYRKVSWHVCPGHVGGGQCL